MAWIILGVISVVLLVVYFRSRNAVWGGLTIGIIAGLIIAFFSGEVFSWYTVGKITIVCVLIGFGVELLGKISDKMKNKIN